MSRTNQRTWQKQRTGHFLLTVHLDSPSEAGRREKHPKLADFVRHMLHLADENQLPVTWAVSDPAYSAATPLILRSAGAHELAILGDANWVGPTAGRTRFARELARRVSQARAAGINLKTLVPRVESVHRHIDLVIKQQISAVAGVEPPQANRGLAIPRALHYGVWEIPVSARCRCGRAGGSAAKGFCSGRFVQQRKLAPSFKWWSMRPRWTKKGAAAWRFSSGLCGGSPNCATAEWCASRRSLRRPRGCRPCRAATPQHSILRKAA